LVEIPARFIPLSKVIRDRNLNPRTHLSERQEKHVDIITEELAVLSQDLGVDLVIFTVSPEV